jgi:hypothetical protein
MCAASAAPAPLCTRARVTLAFAPPLPAPALTSPRSATSPAACPCAPCRRCSTPRRRCRTGHRCAVLRRSPRPHVALPLLPPPVQPPLSFPRLATPEPSSRHASEGTAGAARRLEPDPVTTSPLPLFYKAIRCYKAELSSSFLLFPLPPFPRPPTLSRHRTFLAGICRDPSTPSKSPRPTASPPSPLAPRPYPIQLPTFLRRNRFHLEPPLTGAARARPHRRQLPPLDLQPIQVLKSNPHSSLVLVRASLAHVHRSFVGNASDPTRPPHLPVAGRIPPPPVEHTPSQTTL